MPLGRSNSASIRQEQKTGSGMMQMGPGVMEEDIGEADPLVDL